MCDVSDERQVSEEQMSGCVRGQMFCIQLSASAAPPRGSLVIWHVLLVEASRRTEYLLEVRQRLHTAII